jgi:L-fuconolactonase
MRIDSHQHFWHYTPGEFDWISADMEVLKRDYYPSDLQPLLEAAGVEGTICVQARQCVTETEWLLEWAEKFPFIRGVVGWVPLCSPRLREQLEVFGNKSKLRGVRHVLQAESDDRFMMRNDFVHGIRLLTQFELTYDLLIFPSHLSLAYELAKRFPEQRFVIDHIASPSFMENRFEEWAKGMKQIAGCDNVFCKLSGFVTEVNRRDWQTFDFTPYHDAVLESFGTKRILMGSDWPVCTLVTDYVDVVRFIGNYIQRLSHHEQADVWGNNAKEFYGV